MLSQTSTIYDDFGRVAETDAPNDTSTGVTRTGTGYYPNGQVFFTGTLKSNAPANWYEVSLNTNDDGTVSSAQYSAYITALLALKQYFAVDSESHTLVTTYTYDQTESNMPAGAITFDTVTDADGNT